MEPAPSKVRHPWRLKTPEELARAKARDSRRRLNPLRPTIVSLIFVLLYAAPLIHQAIRGGQFTRAGLLFYSAMGGAVFLFAFAVAYFLQYIGLLSLSPKLRLLICSRCFRIDVVSKNGQCPCGGVMEDAGRWTPAYCPRCGYDLRGTPDRCPECGTKNPPKMVWVGKR